MNRRDKVIVSGVVGVLLLGLGIFAAVASADDKKPDDKKPAGPCPDGMIPNPARDKIVRSGLRGAALAQALKGVPLCVPAECPDGFRRDARTGRCLSIDDPSVEFCPDGMRWNAATGECEAVDDDVDPAGPGNDPCGPGMMHNPARAAIIRSGLRGQALASAMAKAPPCVPIECPAGYHRDPRTGTCVLSDAPPDDDVDIDDIIKDFPEDNAFYQIKQGDIMGWGVSGTNWNAVTQNVLARALFLAAREYGGMSDDEAQDFANANRKNTGLTNEIYDAILCSGMNDWAYATYGYCGDVAIANGVCPASMRNRPSSVTGRAIRPLTHHADNATRLRQGLPMARTVAILTPAKKGNGKGNPVAKAQPGGDNSYPLLWIPGIDRERLWNSGGQSLVFVPSQADPPGWISEAGVFDYSGSTLTVYGCGYGERRTS